MVLREIPGSLIWAPVVNHWSLVVGPETSPVPATSVFSPAVVQQQLARVGVVARVAVEERQGLSLQLRNTSYGDQAKLLAFLRQYYPNHPTLGHRIDWTVGPMIQT